MADAERIRGLAARVCQWPRATGEARRLASVLWHDAGDPAAAAGLSSVIARLTGEMRAARYDRDPEIRAAFDRLRREVAALVDAEPGKWDASPHDTFAARTRAACRDAGLDLTQP